MSPGELEVSFREAGRSAGHRPGSLCVCAGLRTGLGGWTCRWTHCLRHGGLSSAAFRPFCSGECPPSLWWPLRWPHTQCHQPVPVSVPRAWRPGRKGPRGPTMHWAGRGAGTCVLVLSSVPPGMWTSARSPLRVGFLCIYPFEGHERLSPESLLNPKLPEEMHRAANTSAPAEGPSSPQTPGPAPGPGSPHRRRPGCLTSPPRGRRGWWGSGAAAPRSGGWGVMGRGLPGKPLGWCRAPDPATPSRTGHRVAGRGRWEMGRHGCRGPPLVRSKE